mmetsp:Transcript_78418/g.162920  ORF Transcript_78418/g.162920 Transcript_78418/m.162920 type:complete len:227 (-) Transcript_78418:22-702(-)
MFETSSDADTCWPWSDDQIFLSSTLAESQVAPFLNLRKQRISFGQAKGSESPCLSQDSTALDEEDRRTSIPNLTVSMDFSPRGAFGWDEETLASPVIEKRPTSLLAMRRGFTPLAVQTKNLTQATPGASSSEDSDSAQEADLRPKRSGTFIETYTTLPELDGLSDESQSEDEEEEDMSPGSFIQRKAQEKWPSVCYPPALLQFQYQSGYGNFNTCQTNFSQFFPRA